MHHRIVFAPARPVARALVLGCLLLARIDGTSPVDHLIEERGREAVRMLARRLLRERIRTWDEVLRLAGQV
jgi:hypothetical protein